MLLGTETDQGWGEHHLAAEEISGPSITVALDVQYVPKTL